MSDAAFILGLLSTVISAVVAAFVARDRSKFDARVRQEVEAHLGDLAARRQYEFDAKRRLYEALGPLRFQLVAACREAARRVEFHPKQEWDMDISHYFARDTLHRLLRPLAVAELIQRQMNYVDFSLDPHLLVYVRFHTAAYGALTGDGVLSPFEVRPDWATETQHVFKGRLREAAHCLIVADPDLRVCRTGELDPILDAASTDSGLWAFARLLDGFTITDNPIFWLRLCCYAYCCDTLAQWFGPDVGLTRPPIDLRALVAHAGLSPRQTTASPDDPIAALWVVLDARLGPKPKPERDQVGR